MWLSAIKLAMNAGTHISKKKQETKMMMANAQAKHAEKMASGEIEYSGKLLEARQSDWKDEAVLVILTLPILVIAWGVFSDDPNASAKIKEFFEQFQQLPSWFTYNCFAKLDVMCSWIDKLFAPRCKCKRKKK